MKQMKKLFILFTFILAATTFAARAYDVDKDSIDSLKQKLQLTTNDTLKGVIYTQIASEYLKFDRQPNRNLKAYYQTEAIHYTLLALHNYSYYEDTTGIRGSFDDLAHVYVAQRKFSEAKWFTLQSNKISRQIKDIPNIINSLVKLSAIKMELKEYKMALRDLNEALKWSSGNNMPKLEAVVQQNYAYLYNRLKDYEKGDAAEKRATELGAQAQLDDEKPVSISFDNTIAKPVVVKKKKVLVSTKKNAKSVAVGKLASL
ncbi:tetratricopeptide (TPR) repeat protein [Mucilaginibacter sp. UYP25]